MPKFNPENDPQIRAETWKPNAHLTGLALRRCSWINCEQMNAITDAEEWLRAIIVGAYYQGIADLVRYNSRKLREAQKGGKQ